MDRGTDFDLYKKIFEYEGIPLVAFQDEKLTKSYDIFIIKNLASLIIRIKNNKLDKEFKYYFTSILRSYLYEIPDNKIFEIFEKNTFKEEELYIKSQEISKYILSLCIIIKSSRSFNINFTVNILFFI